MLAHLAGFLHILAMILLALVGLGAFGLFLVIVIIARGVARRGWH